MPDLSQDDIHANAPLAVASERQIWNNLSPEGRAQLLGQSIAGESNISNKESVYQKDPKSRSYESMDYSSLPQSVQYDVSHLLHEMGYFKETYGATVYEVEGDDRFECKDCEEPFISEEDLRVHRKINHDDNGESETESQEAYNYSLNIDPSMTKDNLLEARKIIRGESSRVDYPQNEPKGPVTDPPLPKGRREYDDNPNHYFYDNKLFKRGSRGGNYDQTGVALTEARALIQLEEKILDKYGWESTKDVERDTASRQVFATEVAKVVNVENLHPRTIKIIDSVNKPFLVNTLTSLGAKWAKESADDTHPSQTAPSDATDPSDTPIEDIPYRGDVHSGASTQDVDPFSQFEEPVLHQDYDPEDTHEHNAFDQNFGDKVAEEQDVETGWLDPDTGELVQERLKKGSVIDPEDTYGQGYRDNPAYKKDADEEEGTDGERETITGSGGEDVAMREIEDNYNRASKQMSAQKEDPYQEYEWQKGQEDQKDVTRTCPTCGFYSEDEQDLNNHKQNHANEDQWKGGIDPKELEDVHDAEIEKSGHPENWTLSGEPRQINAIKEAMPEWWNDPKQREDAEKANTERVEQMQKSEEDFPFEEDATTVTTVTEEPELLDNVNTDVLQVEGEQYDPEEKYDKKAEEARTISNYIGAPKTKAGESIQNILDGAIDVPIERESVNETIYNRKLEGYHEDKIARELSVYHGIEYEEAIEKIRGIEVNGNDITAKTLYGKKFADCNEAEISEMKILGGEAKKSSMGTSIAPSNIFWIDSPAFVFGAPI